MRYGQQLTARESEVIVVSPVSTDGGSPRRPAAVRASRLPGR